MSFSDDGQGFPAEALETLKRLFEAFADMCGDILGQAKRTLEYLLPALIEVAKQVAQGLSRGIELQSEAVTEVLAAGSKPIGRVVGALRNVGGGQAILRFASLLLPAGLRAEWLEEQRGYLWDLPTRREKLRWAIGELVGMPRYVYTVRTGTRQEPA